MLEEVSLRVCRGEQWAVLGANGAGKTALLRVLTGYRWPQGGRVRVLGETFGVVDRGALRRRVGLSGAAVGQWHLRHHGSAPAWEVVLSGREGSIGLYRPAAAGERGEAVRLLERFGAGRVADQPFATLSQGEQQKVLLARALIGRPELLLLDEPCAGLDLKSREELVRAVGRTLAEGPTVLYVTHHPEEVLPGFTHALLLAGGRVAAAGRKEEVLTNDRLTQAWGVGVEVRWSQGQPWVRVREKEPDSAGGDGRLHDS